MVRFIKGEGEGVLESLETNGLGYVVVAVVRYVCLLHAEAWLLYRDLHLTLPGDKDSLLNLKRA